jgi:DNA polymerase I-like protein with 3'-5' exonuclease and polymerase domains
MKILTIDYETLYTSDYSLSKMSTEEYVRDSRFEIVGVAVKQDNFPTEFFTGTLNETRSWLAQFDWAGSFALAQNTIFDAAIHQWVCKLPPPKGWLDTMSMSRAIDGTHESASLAALAKRWTSGKEKGTEVLNALGKRRIDFSETEMHAYGRYCMNDVELTYEIFNKMVEAGFPSKELRVIDRTIQMFVYPQLELNLPALCDHLQAVKQRKEELLSMVAVGKDDLMSNDKFAQALRDLGVEPPTKISQTTGKETYAFAKTDEAFKALAEHDDERVQALVAARLGNKSTLEETRTEKFIAAATRGPCAIPLSYCGAMTHRWAGADGMNFQNIPRDSPMKAAMCAPEGDKLIGIDLSNIELRVGMWLAGQDDKLDMFRNKRDLYKEFATKVFGVPYDAVTKDQRQVSKTACLALIFGTGAGKLRATLKTMSGKDIGDEEAQRIVDIYRDDNPFLVQTWGRGKEAITAIAKQRTMRFGRNDVIAIEDGRAYKPSGLALIYPDLKQEVVDDKLQWTYKTRKGFDRIYGAKFFQQCVQSLARDVMAEILVACKPAPILTVHDALYFSVGESTAEATFERLMTTFTTPPSWAPELPLAAEGGIGNNMKEV